MVTTVRTECDGELNVRIKATIHILVEEERDRLMAWQLGVSF